MTKLLKILVVTISVLLLLVILVPVGIIFFRPNQIISKAEAKKELSLPGSHFINWRGAELHYVEQGSGDTILMIHGFGATVRNFGPLADLMQDRFHVIRVDLPGFGLSDIPDLGEHPNYTQMYRDYLSFIFDTLHLHNVYVIGNSMGGGIAWMAAAEHPDNVKKLVLLNSAGYDVASIAAKLTIFKYKGMAYIFKRGWPMSLSRVGLQKSFFNPQLADPELWKMNNLNTNRQGNIDNMLAFVRSGQYPDSAEIKKVTCPTLIIWGQQDSMIPVTHAEKFHHDIKISKVVILDSCGHLPMLERPVDVANAFLDFRKDTIAATN